MREIEEIQITTDDLVEAFCEGLTVKVSSLRP
jgi:hypothetical protein